MVEVEDVEVEVVDVEFMSPVAVIDFIVEIYSEADAGFVGVDGLNIVANNFQFLHRYVYLCTLSQKQ